MVLGTGEEQYQSMLNYYASKYPNKVAAILTFDSALAQQIIPSDMFLMPSLFEPWNRTTIAIDMHNTHSKRQVVLKTL